MSERPRDEDDVASEEFIHDFQILMTRELNEMMLLTQSPSLSPLRYGLMREAWETTSEVHGLLFGKLPYVASRVSRKAAERLLSLMRDTVLTADALQGTYDYPQAVGELARWLRSWLSGLMYGRIDANELSNSELSESVVIPARFLDKDMQTLFERVMRRLDELVRRAADVSLKESTASAQEALQRIAVTEAEVDEVSEHKKEAAGDEAASSLAEHFDTHAKAQTKVMWLLRGVGVVFIVAGVVFAALVVFKTEKPLSWDNEVARLALTLPLAFLAYYCLREASHHRDAAQSARENAVRLKTIRAYADAVDPEQKRELFQTLGIRVFSKGEVAPVGSDELIDPKDATSLVGAITALLGVALKK